MAQEAESSVITLDWFSLLPQIKPLGWAACRHGTCCRMPRPVSQVCRPGWQPRYDELWRADVPGHYSSFATALKPPPERCVPDTERLSGKVLRAIH